MRYWYVTSVCQADVALDGPFERRDDCEVRCVVRADTLSTLRAVLAGRLVSYYVPRQFETRVEVPHLYRSKEVVAPPLRTQGPGLLPPIVYTYARGNLLVLCRALGLDAPPHAADRAQIILHMEAQLHMLSKGASKDDT